MAHASKKPAATEVDHGGWYDRWINDISDDVAAAMEGESERQARIDDLHYRLDQMRERFRRVRPEHRGRGPRVDVAPGSEGDDARIQADVNTYLTNDMYVDASGNAIGVNGGHVTLTGTVDSRAAKRLAEDCADAAAGVRDVHNNLRIV